MNFFSKFDYKKASPEDTEKTVLFICAFITGIRPDDEYLK